MKLRGELGLLTYCTNIHPGESLEALERALREHTRVVRGKLTADTFGVGLRIAAHAAEELEAGALASFAALLRELGMYVFTINGFPYGSFHGARVKERVYQPDWSHPDRAGYTRSLARTLAALLPEQEPYGSISTVPGAFRDDAEPQQVARALIEHAAMLVQLERETGRRIVLALEPEPHCMLETTDEAITFFREQLWSRSAVEQLARLVDQPPARAEALMRRHLGVCLDLCHAAVEFEEPDACIDALQAAELFVAKVQVSAGLTVDPRRSEARAALAAFHDDVYLHQVVARHGTALTRYLDLPDAELDTRAADEWRVHFHVPIFHAQLAELGTTQAFVRRFLARHAQRPVSRHLEVETYTWDVLPAALRGVPVADAIARELQWVLHELDA